MISHSDIPQHQERVFFLIPAYNEEDNLEFLFSNIDRFMHFFGYTYQIFLVNDGSSDRTVQIAAAYQEKGLPLTVLQHETNYGPGAAFRTGFEALLPQTEDQDMVVTIEADNTSDLCVLNRMFEQCQRGSDLVLASVYGEGTIVGAPLHRRIFSYGCNLLLQLLLRIRGVNTFTSFFRVYRASMLKQTLRRYGDKFIEEPGFICMIELLVKFHHAGYTIMQVPMLLDSRIRIGKSKMRSFKNIQDTLKFLRKYFLHRERILLSNSQTHTNV